MTRNSRPFVIFSLFSEREDFDPNPPYQRDGGAWSTDLKQSLVDSIMNGFDIPKIYLAEVTHTTNGKPAAYAIVDGKQRLTAIWDFMEGKYKTASDFICTKFRDMDCKGKLFEELPGKVKSHFQNQTLDCVVLSGFENDEIEDLFSRLNSGVALNNAEKRNALGGALNARIKEIASSHAFFTDCVRANKKRGTHLEALAKFFLIEERQGATDLKKQPLDRLVKSYKTASPELDELIEKTTKRLDEMCMVFSSNDPLLQKHASIPLFYLLDRTLRRDYSVAHYPRALKSFLEQFEALRTADKQNEPDERDPELTHFDLLSQQGTATEKSLEERLVILISRFLTAHPESVLKDPRRSFNHAERLAIWVRATKKCETCAKELRFDEMDADHAREHSRGGKTCLKNGRCLCIRCNRGRSDPR